MKRKHISVDVGNDDDVAEQGQLGAAAANAVQLHDELVTVRHGNTGSTGGGGGGVFSAPLSTRSDVDMGADHPAPGQPNLVHSYSQRVAGSSSAMSSFHPSSASGGGGGGNGNPLSASSLKRHRSNPVSESPSMSASASASPSYYSGLSPLHATMHLHSPGGSSAAVPTASGSPALSASAAFAANLRLVSAARFDLLSASPRGMMAHCQSPSPRGGPSASAPPVAVSTSTNQHQLQQLAPLPPLGLSGSTSSGDGGAAPSQQQQPPPLVSPFTPHTGARLTHFALLQGESAQAAASAAQAVGASSANGNGNGNGSEQGAGVAAAPMATEAQQSNGAK